MAASFQIFTQFAFPYASARDIKGGGIVAWFKFYKIYFRRKCEIRDINTYKETNIKYFRFSLKNSVKDCVQCTHTIHGSHREATDTEFFLIVYIFIFIDT